MEGSKLAELAKPFPAKFVKKNPSGDGTYIPHSIITQRLIQVLGAPPSFTVEQVLRGDVAEMPPNPNGRSARAKRGSPPLTNAVVGVIGKMTVTIDGQTVEVSEAGDCEQPHNWTTDGQRLKDAMSDAYKRCAMRLGCGLHLWCPEDKGGYFLHDVLTREPESA